MIVLNVFDELPADGAQFIHCVGKSVNGCRFVLLVFFLCLVVLGLCGFERL